MPGNSHAGEGHFQDALKQFEGVDLPSVADQQLNLDQYQNVGDYSGQLENALNLGSSSMEGISVDPRLAQTQMDVLDQLSQTGQMGMTAAEQAALRDAQRQASAMAQAKTAQIQDNFARQGMGGSGGDLAAQLLAAQSGADRASQASNDVIQNAGDKALNARMQAASLAGNMSNQEFGQKSEVAKAKDYINQFNTQNQQAVQGRNVANQNQGQMFNLNKNQGISNQNTGLKNQQQQFNKGLLQQNFQNQIQKAGGSAGVMQNYGNLAATNQNNADAAQAAMMGDLIKGGAMIAASDKNLKKNIKEVDASSFLDALVPSEYDYKDEKHGEGKQIGIMAQDLEKVAPQMVEEHEDGKYIDYNKAGGPLFASLAALHDRLKKLEGK